MKYRVLSIYVFVAFALSCVERLSAQEVNPTVEVTRRFEGEMEAVHKSYLSLTEIDSSMFQSMNFSYSVFDRIFGKTYDFTPHRFGVAPAAGRSFEDKMLIKAGGGVPFSSEVSFWAGLPAGRFHFDLYGDHSGYFGQVDRLLYNADGRSVKSGTRYRMTDAGYLAGIRGRYEWKSGRLYLDLCYDGLTFADTSFSRSLNSITVTAGAERVCTKDSYFHYDADIRYSRTSDRASVQGTVAENYVGADVVFGPVLGRYHSIMMAFGVDYVSYSGYRNLITGVFDFAPYYRFRKGRWDFNLGVRLSRSYSSEPYAASGSMAPSSSNKTNLLFPDAGVSYNIVRERLSVYAAADGGNHVNRQSDFVRKWHSLGPYGEYGSFQDYTVDPYRLRLGFSGSAVSRLSFDVSGVYGRRRGAPSFAIVDGMPALLGFGLTYDYAGGELRMSWKSQDIEASADVTYHHIFNRKAAGNVLSPSEFDASFMVRYNWNRRFYATLAADCSSAMSSPQYVVPGWIDMGLELEYVLNSMWTLRLEGQNLLNQTVVLCPGVASPGVRVIAGFTLKL